jgi:heme/copper-type cytochrome/quinol oxidase subunit 2
LLDFDLIILPSFIIYSLGLQWAWQFNIIFLPVNIGFESYCDHYIISSINKKLIIRGLATNKSIVSYIINNPAKISSINCMVTRYLFEISQYILLPIYSFIRLFVYSFDVIHTLGFYSWGIKIDAIPGRINLANTLRLLWKGEYRGKCFELCGQGHLSMIINSLVLK